MSRHADFKKLLFNPGLSFNLEDDNENCSGRIIGALEGREGVAGSGVSGVSALRARNVQLLADTDRNYEDERAPRAELQDRGSKDGGGYDPSLAKYFLTEASDEDEPLSKPNNTKSKSRSKRLETKSEAFQSSSKSNNEISSGESEAFGSEDEGSEIAEHSSEGENEFSTSMADTSIGFSFTDGDYGQYGGDDDDDDDSDNDEDKELEADGTSKELGVSQVSLADFDCADSDDGDAVVEAARQKLRKKQLLKRRRQSNVSNDGSNEEDSEPEDSSDNEDSGMIDEDEDKTDITAVKMKSMCEEKKNSEAVLKQFDLYDKLFERRILMQKLVGNTHKLPQPDVYPTFRRLEGYEGQRYHKSLRACTEASQHFMEASLKLQEAMLLSTPNTETVLTDGSLRVSRPQPDDGEEITSSEDEDDNQKRKAKGEEGATTAKNMDESDGNRPEKRKRSDREILEDTEQTLAKRHCNMKPYRNRVVAYWEERTKLLQARCNKGGSSRKGGSFEAFEESFSVLVTRLLNDRDKVLRRTQLRSANRGNYVTPIGGVEPKPRVEINEELDIPIVDESGVLFQRYDPEIYDDTDFYSFALEQVIKMKMLRGTSSFTRAQFLDFTQTLRKKSKKIVDTKRSKGRKLKYDVHSALLQFVAPRGAPEMEDDAIDVVVHSLFGGHKNTGVNIQPGTPTVTAA